MPAGRPLKWTTPEALQKDIDAYFNDTPKDEWTITGLALALDTSRQTLLDYQEKDEFADTVKKAKMKVENGYEIDLKKHGRSGTIFALKNFDWRDKQETDITTQGDKVVFMPTELIQKNGINPAPGPGEDSPGHA